jgi:hypothetical protein
MRNGRRKFLAADEEETFVAGRVRVVLVVASPSPVGQAFGVSVELEEDRRSRV